MTTEGIDVRSVGNTLILHETALIEAFNLKAAIEFQLKNCQYPCAGNECIPIQKRLNVKKICPGNIFSIALHMNIYLKVSFILLSYS